MERVTLDCSQLRDIRLKMENSLPGTIYIDGQNFLNEFRNIAELMAQPKSEEDKLFELMKVLSSNPKILVFDFVAEKRRVLDTTATAIRIKNQAKELLWFLNREVETKTPKKLTKFRGRRIDNDEVVIGHYFIAPLTEENSGMPSESGWFFLSGSKEKIHCIEKDGVVFSVKPESVEEVREKNL